MTPDTLLTRCAYCPGSGGTHYAGCPYGPLTRFATWLGFDTESIERHLETGTLEEAVAEEEREQCGTVTEWSEER